MRKREGIADVCKCKNFLYLPEKGNKVIKFYSRYRCKNEVESGSIAIVLVGEEATLKRVLYKKGLMILEAANPKIDTKVFTPEEVAELPVKVIGKVLYARRDFD